MTSAEESWAMSVAWNWNDVQSLVMVVRGKIEWTRDANLLKKDARISNGNQSAASTHKGTTIVD
jgi:hypothetical protein